MTQSNIELARRGYEAVLGGDLDTIAELLDPEVRWHGGDPNAAGACHNRQQARFRAPGSPAWPPRRARRAGPLPQPRRRGRCGGGLAGSRSRQPPRSMPASGTAAGEQVRGLCGGIRGCRTRIPRRRFVVISSQGLAALWEGATGVVSKPAMFPLAVMPGVGIRVGTSAWVGRTPAENRDKVAGTGTRTGPARSSA